MGFGKHADLHGINSCIHHLIIYSGQGDEGGLKSVQGSIRHKAGVYTGRDASEWNSSISDGILSVDFEGTTLVYLERWQVWFSWNSAQWQINTYGDPCQVVNRSPCDYWVRRVLTAAHSASSSGQDPGRHGKCPGLSAVPRGRGAHGGECGVLQEDAGAWRQAAEGERSSSVWTVEGQNIATNQTALLPYLGACWRFWE